MLSLPIGNRGSQWKYNPPMLLRELATTDTPGLLGRALMGAATRLHRGKMWKGWKPSSLCQMEVVSAFHRQ